MGSKNNNKMEWIRILEDQTEQENYEMEYEIMSECLITGLFNCNKGKILAGLHTMNKSEDGLYSYLLKVTHSGPKKFDEYAKNATKKGYYFKGGIPGELMVLFSIFFRCRFYLSATIHGKLSKNELRIRTPQKFTRITCNPMEHRPIFSSDKRSFSIDLKEFLDKVKNLPIKYHQQFILAGYHYLLALREVGINTEMVFIRLVSSIEALSKSYELKSKDDPLQDKKFTKLIESLNVDESEKEAIKNIYNTRGAAKKFVKFIEEYSKGYIKGGYYRSKLTRIEKSNLSKTLITIYDARSNYLHNGEPMYLSIPMHGDDKWDTDPSLGKIIDNRKYTAKQKMPYACWFEGLVRHCLINFVNDKTAK